MKKTTSCTLSVAGMHCASCEVLLNKKISKMDGVAAVKASLSDATVEITYSNGHKIALDALNRDFADLGYTFSSSPPGTAQVNTMHLLQAAVILIIFFIAYLIVEDTKLFAQFHLTESSSLPAFFILGVVASLSTCAALVGGVLLAMSKQWHQLYGGIDEAKRALPFALFNIGRLVSFALLGGVLGLVGSVFRLSLPVTAMLIIVVSLIMIVLGLQMLGVPFAKKIRFGFPKFLSQYAADEQNLKGKYMPFVSGALTFFLPCGFTLTAQTIALTTGNFFTSMLMMSAFALGTLPMLGALSFSSLKFAKRSAFSGTFNLLAGIFIVLFGAYNVNAQLNVLGMVSFNDLARRETVVDASVGLGVELIETDGKQMQYVTMEAREFAYLPKTIRLKAGIPTKLTVNNYDVSGCAQAMWLGGLYDEVLYLNKPTVEAMFTPKPGTYKISCTMGMVEPVIVTVES